MTARLFKKVKLDTLHTIAEEAKCVDYDLLVSLAAYFVCCNISGLRELMDRMEVDLAFPITVFGKNRRHVYIKDKRGAQVMLEMPNLAEVVLIIPKDNYCTKEMHHFCTDDFEQFRIEKESFY